MFKIINFRTPSKRSSWMNWRRRSLDLHGLPRRNPQNEAKKPDIIGPMPRNESSFRGARLEDLPPSGRGHFQPKIPDSRPYSYGNSVKLRINTYSKINGVLQWRKDKWAWLRLLYRKRMDSVYKNVWHCKTSFVSERKISKTCIFLENVELLASFTRNLG